MKEKKFAERGALMVEMVAVIALLGVMGTVLFRQINQRNQELDHINMASEIRTVKEATQAYIQANRSYLEANCVLDGDYGYVTLDNAEIDYFMPDNWASNHDEEGSLEDGLVYEYGIYLTCYEIDSELAPRKALYATIMPHDWALPEGFTLRRASRVANLIGADGGVYTDGALHGTMGAWEVLCPFDSEGNNVCDEREDNFFVATTGVDIYIPEVEDAPDNAVVVPDSIAFNRLHSTDYFSVGDGDGTANCIGNMTAEGKFAHEAVDPDSGVPTASADDIRNVGTANCDPLFWVGTTGPSVETDRSEAGQVYVKKNLYVGRDNANNRHAVAIEGGEKDADNSVTVFSADGDERLMLDGTGKVVGRSADGKGYRLDAENGEIVLFEEKTVGEKVIQVPTMRLKYGAMRTDKAVTYTGDDGSAVTDTYKVDPAYTSLMNDIRLTSRGGARLSEILPNYITKTITSYTFNNGTAQTVGKPTCPGGYVRAIMVTPVSWSQYITEANLTLPAVSDTGAPAIELSDTDPTEKDIDVTKNDAKLQLKHQKPVQIRIDNGDSWSVLADYSGTAATNADPISVMVQTYCVFDEANFDGDDGVSESVDGNGLGQEEGTTEGQEIGPKDRNCSEDADCDNTEECSADNICVSLGHCTADDLTKKLYCIDGRYVHVECTTDEECGEGQTCLNNRCKTK